MNDAPVLSSQPSNNDLVERLRDHALYDKGERNAMFMEAAARIEELEGALRDIEGKTNGDRPTVNPENAFEHWGKLNALLVIIRGFARAALSPKPAGETGHG